MLSIVKYFAIRSLVATTQANGRRAAPMMARARAAGSCSSETVTQVTFGNDATHIIGLAKGAEREQSEEPMARRRQFSGESHA